MPFTPFHFGPGLIFKSIFRRFSFTLFAFSQVVIDLEPLYFIITHNPPVHRFFHTFLGANLVAVVCVLIGKPICELGLKIMTKIFQNKSDLKISWSSAIITSLVGAYSHVFLDSIMHRDMHPFTPFSQANPFLRIVEPTTLHYVCLLAGVIGPMIYFLRKRYLR